MNKKLTGKAALVTGGSRGIGAAIARSLAEDGADVAISYVSSPDKAKALVRELQEKGRARGRLPGRPGQARRSREPGAQGRRALRSSRHPREQRGRVHHRSRRRSERRGRRAAVRDQRGRCECRRARSREAHDRRRPHHFDRLDGRDVVALAGHLRLLGDQGGGRRVHARLGARSGPEGHHGQRHRAGSHRHRHESRATATSPPCRKRARRSGATAVRKKSAATVAFLASKNAGFITGASIAVDGGYNA